MVQCAREVWSGFGKEHRQSRAAALCAEFSASSTVERRASRMVWRMLSCCDEAAFTFLCSVTSRSAFSVDSMRNCRKSKEMENIVESACGRSRTITNSQLLSSASFGHSHQAHLHSGRLHFGNFTLLNPVHRLGKSTDPRITQGCKGRIVPKSKAEGQTRHTQNFHGNRQS